MVYAYLLWDIKNCKRILEIWDTEIDKDFFFKQDKVVIRVMEISGIVNYSKEKVIEV